MTFNSLKLRSCVNQFIQVGGGSKVRQFLAGQQVAKAARPENKAPLKTLQCLQKRRGAPGSLIQVFNTPRSPKYKNVQIMNAIVPMNKPPLYPRGGINQVQHKKSPKMSPKKSSQKSPKIQPTIPPKKSPQKAPTSRLYGWSGKTSRSPKQQCPHSMAQRSFYWRVLDANVSGNFPRVHGVEEKPAKKPSPPVVVTKGSDLMDMTDVLRQRLKSFKKGDTEKGTTNEDTEKRWYRRNKSSQLPHDEKLTQGKSNWTTMYKNLVNNKTEAEVNEEKLEAFRTQQKRIFEKLRDAQRQRFVLRDTFSSVCGNISSKTRADAGAISTKILQLMSKDVHVRKSAYDTLSSYRYTGHMSPTKKEKFKRLLDYPPACSVEVLTTAPKTVEQEKPAKKVVQKGVPKKGVPKKGVPNKGVPKKGAL